MSFCTFVFPGTGPRNGKHRWFLSACALYAILLSQSVLAEESKKITVGTREELRACLKETERLDKLRVTLDANAAAHQHDLAAIEVSANKLLKMQSAMSGDAEDLDKFNAEVQTHNEFLAQARVRADGYRKFATDFNARIFANNERCGLLIFRPEDQAAVKRERSASQ